MLAQATGIMEMRQALEEKEDAKSLKQKTREGEAQDGQAHHRLPETPRCLLQVRAQSKTLLHVHVPEVLHVYYMYIHVMYA